MTASRINGDEHAPASVHLATRATDGTGAIIKGSEIDEAEAVKQRRAGQDIGVCGDNPQANRQIALELEQAIGPWMRQNKHVWSAGPMALPHFQQRDPPPHGHTFYETASARARKSK